MSNRSHTHEQKTSTEPRLDEDLREQDSYTPEKRRASPDASDPNRIDPYFFPPEDMVCKDARHLLQ